MGAYFDELATDELEIVRDALSHPDVKVMLDERNATYLRRNVEMRLQERGAEDRAAPPDLPDGDLQREMEREDAGG